MISSNGPALSYHAERTGTGPCFPRWRPVGDRGQTREICEIHEKYFKGKVVTFTIQSLILYQCPVDLLTFFALY